MFVDNNLILAGAIAQIQGAPGGPGQVTATITGQTVTGASAVCSTNCIDLLQKRDIGEGADLYSRIQVTTAFAGLTALDIQLWSADTAPTGGGLPSTATNPTLHNSLQAIPVANLTAGASFALELTPYLSPQGANTTSVAQRFWFLVFNPTGTGTAGAVFADLGLEIQDGRDFYPSGFGII